MTTSGATGTSDPATLRALAVRWAGRALDEESGHELAAALVAQAVREQQRVALLGAASALPQRMDKSSERSTVEASFSPPAACQPCGCG